MNQDLLEAIGVADLSFNEIENIIQLLVAKQTSSKWSKVYYECV